MVALVTGAQRGIGAAIARELAARGAQVVLGHVVESERAAALADELPDAWPLEFDVTDPEAVAGAFSTIAERAGRIDIVINNAGLRADGLAMRLKDEEWRRAMAVNLDGVFHCCREALKLMRKGGGSIVNISSVAAFAGSVGQANYAAAKAGVIGLSRSLALEYAGRGIRVNCVVPGLVDTEMTEQLKPAMREQFLSQIPLKRFGTPEEVAHAAAFLAGPESSYITGAVLHVNGGGYIA
jgi:3-oxoacyl-[acyl-carrier protein] reductase